MASALSLFPQLTEEHIIKTGILSSEYGFFYSEGGDTYYLRCDAIDGSNILGRLVDERGVWTADEHNLGVRKTVTLLTARNLFGPNGVACRGAVIGVALMWASTQSRQRGTVDFGEITHSGDGTAELEYSFSVGQLRGTVELSIVLYIKHPAKQVMEDEIHLANSTGYLLGEITDKLMIQLDGTGSMFPIFEETRLGGPLWRVVCQYEDPMYDLFGESIKIYFNRGHAAYKMIDKKDKKYNPQLLKEVMASALSIVIIKIKQDEDAWSVVEAGDHAEPGSIAEAITYFRDTLEWKMDSVESISLSIREFFDKRM